MYQATTSAVSTNRLIKFPFQYAIIPSVGKSFYPYVSIGLNTVFGWKKYQFIVDTGADLTTLPYYMAASLNINLARCRKSQTEGIGGFIVKTWETTITLNLQGHLAAVRCAITQDTKTPFLLGRVDLLEKNMSWHFDSREKTIVFELLS